jgi:hypothetical protein
MYKRRTPGAKRDPIKQWALPDRVFFAAGACHMLAFAFLERYPHSGFEAKWIRPAAGHTGNHIVVVRDGCVFDYHGFADWSRYWTHAVRRANQWWPGWSAAVVNIRMDALVSRRRAREYEGLWMKEPQEFLFDPSARAGRYLERFPAPLAVNAAAG